MTRGNRGKTDNNEKQERQTTMGNRGKAGDVEKQVEDIFQQVTERRNKYTVYCIIIKVRINRKEIKGHAGFVFVFVLFSDQLWLFNGQVDDSTAGDFFHPLNGSETGSHPSLTTRDRGLVSVL